MLRRASYLAVSTPNPSGFWTCHSAPKRIGRSSLPWAKDRPKVSRNPKDHITRCPVTPWICGPTPWAEAEQLRARARCRAQDAVMVGKDKLRANSLPMPSFGWMRWA